MWVSPHCRGGILATLPLGAHLWPSALLTPPCPCLLLVGCWCSHHGVAECGVLLEPRWPQHGGRWWDRPHFPVSPCPWLLCSWQSLTEDLGRLSLCLGQHRAGTAAHQQDKLLRRKIHWAFFLCYWFCLILGASAGNKNFSTPSTSPGRGGQYCVHGPSSFYVFHCIREVNSCCDSGPLGDWTFHLWGRGDSWGQRLSATAWEAMFVSRGCCNLSVTDRSSPWRVSTLAGRWVWEAWQSMLGGKGHNCYKISAWLFPVRKKTQKMRAINWVTPFLRI